MKSLKMKFRFLCSILGLQILLRLNTVWAADGEPTSMDIEMIDRPGETTGNDVGDNRGQAVGEKIDAIFANLGQENFDPNDFEKLMNDYFPERITQHDDNANKAKDFFRWPEGEAYCDNAEKRLNRGIVEAETLSKIAIEQLDRLRAYIPRETPPFREKDENIFIATGHIWGAKWVTSEIRYRPLTQGKEVMGLVKGNYDSFLQELHLQRSPDNFNRVALVCTGWDGVKVVIDEETNERYWNFTNFNILKPIREDLDPNYCGSDKPRTAVWPDLVWICHGAWPRPDVTLEDMIENQENSPVHFQLEDRLTMGGIMMHVLMHLFGIAGDRKVNINFRPGMSIKKSLVSTTNDMESAWTYFWCVALARKDRWEKKAPADWESLKNAQSYVWYATYSALILIEWWKRAGLQPFLNWNEKKLPPVDELNRGDFWQVVT